jgi:toxin ParE1/3/4
MRIIYHPEAEAELVATTQFYEGRVAKLGTEFLIAAERAIQTIQDAPERWPIMEADVRRYLMPRFPFSIYYRHAGDELRILAFKHHSRHPDYLRERLSG